MSSHKERGIALAADPEKQRVDEAIEAYVCWREARDGVAESYQDWCNATARDAPHTYSVYVVALDLEETAAALYRAALCQLQQLLGFERSLTCECGAGEERAAVRQH